MPQFPFLRSSQDKNADPSPQSPSQVQSASSSSQASTSTSQPPQFTHPFASSSTNASSATINANASSSTSGNASSSAVPVPAFVPAESPTSKYHPSRLLRRKASLSNKSNDPPTFSESEPLPTTSNGHIGSTGSEPPTSPRRLPSSPRGFPSPPRGFFFDGPLNRENGSLDKERDRERDKFSTYPTRRGSETSRTNLAYGLSSPSSSGASTNQAKRSAFVYDGQLQMSNEGDEPVVIIPSSSASTSGSREEAISLNLAALGLGTNAEALPLSSSLPKVLDGGLGSNSGKGMGIFDKVMQGDGLHLQPQNAIVDDGHRDGSRNRDRDKDGEYEPPTPPDSATTPFYPTALSPPRRPMPRSPRALANQRAGTPTNAHHVGGRPETPPSMGMFQALSAVGGPSSGGSTSAAENRTRYNTSSSPNLRLQQQQQQQQQQQLQQLYNENSASPTPASSNRAEWLARKPSLSSGTQTPNRQRPHQHQHQHQQLSHHRPSLSVDQGRSSSASRNQSDSPTLRSHLVDKPPSTPKRQGSLDDSPRIVDGSDGTGTNGNMRSGPRSRKPSFSSSFESDTDAALSSDADGEIGAHPHRQSISLLTPSRGSISVGASANRRSPNGNGNGNALSIPSGYEVIVNCISTKGENENDNDNGNGNGNEKEIGEIKWEVTIKKQSSQSPNTPTSPLQLSTGGVTATAPHSASSINLSLSLDQPTGKLVFISFPMDIHATPTRKRRPSMVSRIRDRDRDSSISSPRGMLSAASVSLPSPRPSTPPNQMQSNLVGTPTEGTLSRTPSSRRKPPPPWPSPRTTNPISPPASPRDVFTPRKSGTPTRMGVNGDLLNKVTRGDGME
ncbi:uncharacterized protein I303_101497 [Kwoniella dejecticola CBS 10117]|uniref:Uncharacterized protein n=1 Tax=Kwoniella dejecticola CBS 10117 TaxID=1296121 RepID=A0A1A6ADK9_9TREE|nr:uncharacterized protein I303_02370 [Kwoniella dejecticola CBS 10117]OBR88150.1 hypothetical protein I303_02370 [Kwoniella dejecticola CBS 10117]